MRGLSIAIRVKTTMCLNENVTRVKADEACQFNSSGVNDRRLEQARRKNKRIIGRSSTATTL